MLAAHTEPIYGTTGSAQAAETDLVDLRRSHARLREQVEAMQHLLRKSEDRRRAMLHIMVDINEANRRLADQRALLAPPSETASRRGAMRAFRSAIHNDIEALLAA